VFEHLRKSFGLECNSIRVRGVVKINDGFVSFPIGLRTLVNMSHCGARWSEIFHFLVRSRMLKEKSVFVKYRSVGEVLSQWISATPIRLFFDTLFGVSGISPYRLPSRYLSKDNITNLYEANKPEYLPEGNGLIPALLGNIALKTGRIVRNVKADEILIENGRAVGVKVGRDMYKAKVVISNASVKATVLELSQSQSWPASFYEHVRQTSGSLMVVNIFLIFSRALQLPPGVSLFFMPYDVLAEFDTLEKGQFPRDSMFILHVPTNIKGNEEPHHRATLQFYYPKGKVGDDLVKRQVNRILNTGLGDLIRGFPEAIISYTVYDPFQYRDEFGFLPQVFGVSPDLFSERLPIQLPIRDLFCVGDSVEPDGPCVAQAMESGLRCARMIAARLGTENPWSNHPEFLQENRKRNC